MNHTKGEIEIFTLKGRLPKVKELKMPHKEASRFEANIITTDGRGLFRLDFGYGKKEDVANAERLVKCWNCHDDLVAACRGFMKFANKDLPKGANFPERWLNKLKEATGEIKAALAKAEKTPKKT